MKEARKVLYWAISEIRGTPPEDKHILSLKNGNSRAWIFNFNKMGILKFAPNN